MVAKLEWKITGSPRGKISIPQELVCMGRCVRRRLRELGESYKATFENRDLAFITHWRLATDHFEKSFYGNKLGFNK
jgi:hypothetical protein